MGAILQFIKTYLHLLLFVLLQIVSITSIIRFHAFHKTAFFNTSSYWVGKTTTFLNGINKFRHLPEQNNALVNENLYLRSLLKENYYIQPKDTFYVNDTFFRQRYQYVSASVVGNSTDKENNYLTLNRGLDAGITKGMGVFGPDGIVGVVEQVSANFSLVMSMLHSKAIISPKIKEINLSQGRVKWDNRSPYYVYLSGINRYEKIEKGQLVVTSPYSQNFPENIPIGTVQEVKEVDGSFLRVKVKLSTSFSQLREVYVVKDLFKEELDNFTRRIESEN